MMKLGSILLATLLCALASCVGSDPPSDAGPEPEACTENAAMCSSPYSVCVDVANGQGHCVDWRTVGATPCPSGPSDCPTPSARIVFDSGEQWLASAVCIAKDELQSDHHGAVMLSDGAAETYRSGYCAGYQGALDFAHEFDCSNEPCGSAGHCGITFNTNANANTVECLWPL